MANASYALTESVLASLIGSAVGDALGLPYENLSARRAARLLGEPDRYRLALRRGMVSDDAEHACMTCAAFAESGGDVERFRRALARRLRGWLLTIPVGIGLATLKSTAKLWLGVPPHPAGVRSAGNGPAMRAAVLGRLVDEPDRLADFVAASTQLTHRDDRAMAGAFAVARASACFASEPRGTLRDVIRDLDRLATRGLDVSAMIKALRDVADSIAQAEPTTAFAQRTCRRPGRVSGYILETVPVALHAAFAHGDAMAAIRAAIRCGGDTDSVASIAGGIVGCHDGAMIDRLIEWPCDQAWLQALARSAAHGTAPPRFPVVRRLPRNGLLLTFVLFHVARRCLPPY